jgi:arsenate reductase
LHVAFDDPPALAREVDSDDEALVIYRRVRDEIRAFIEGLPDGLR